MQTPKNAFDLFPADQFDAWVDGVRSKIIDGLEHQHMPGGSQVKVPELSSKALEAIETARREEELTRQAIASSSSLSNQLEAEPMDLTIEMTQEVTTTTTFEEYEEGEPEDEQSEGELGYPAEAAGSEVDDEDEVSEAGYEGQSPPRFPVDEPLNESYDDDEELGSELGDDAEGEYDEDEAEDDRSRERQSEDEEEQDGSEDEFEILGSDEEIGDQERDELSSNEDGDEASISRDRQSEGEDDVEDEDDQLGSDIDMGEQLGTQAEVVTTNNQFAALAGAPEQSTEDDLLQPDENAASADEDPAPDTHLPMNAVRDVPGDEAIDDDEEMAGPGSDAEDEVFSVQDSSDEEDGSGADGGSQSATGGDAESAVQSGGEEGEEELEEGDVMGEDGSQRVQARDGSEVDETGSTADVEDAQSRGSRLRFRWASS